MIVVLPIIHTSLTPDAMEAGTEVRHINVMRLVLRLLCAALLLPLAAQAWSGDYTAHTVMRGESVESVAAKYGMTVEQFVTVVPMAKNMFFTGMTLQIPNGAIGEQIINDPLFDRYVEQGDRKFANARYKDATKLYSKALELHKTADLYYSRGLAYYRREKYGDATSDFRECLALNPPVEVRQEITQLIDKAEELQRQKQMRQAETTAAIMQLAVTGVNTYLQVKQQQQAAKQQQAQMNTSSGNGGSSYSGSSDYDYGGSSAATGSGKRKECRLTSVHDVKHCNGTGRCWKCNGEGSYHDNGQGIAKVVTCKTCGGSGVCPSCGGTGYLD